MFRSLGLISVIATLGCAHQQATKTTAPVAHEEAPVASAAAAPVAAAAVEPTCSQDGDCASNQLCIRGRCTDIAAGLAECRQLRVHFDFNSSLVAEDNRPALMRSARCLGAEHSLHVTIEGNADERGTEEYNMALGDQRATAVAKYLRALGVSDGQLKTVSYGKEKPLCTEHDEECWSKNRRADLDVANVAAKKPARNTR